MVIYPDNKPIEHKTIICFAYDKDLIQVYDFYCARYQNISYNEFLTSIIDSKKFITNDRLDKAFRLFDKDGNGKLSIEEIRGIFGGDEEKWQQIIQDIDLNEDGEVDFEEFKQLMTGTKSRELLQENMGNTRKG